MDQRHRFRRPLLVSAAVGFIIPIFLWGAVLVVGLDVFTPPTLLVWPTMIVMFVLIGNQSHVVALAYLLLSAALNAAIYLVVTACIAWLMKYRRRLHRG